MDGDGFLDGGQGLLPPPQVRQADRLVVQRRGEVGQEGVGAGLRRAARWMRDGFLDGGQGLLPPPQVAPGGSTGCSATRRGRAGRRRGGPAASWRWMVTASSMAARASSRRPRLARRTDWLFSDVARSGRKASGRAAASCAVDGDGFLDGGQGLLPPPQVGQAGPTGCSATVARSGRKASGRAAASWRRMVTASSMAARASSRRPRSDQAVRLVVQRRGQVGQEGVGAGRGQLRGGW